jgi:hypothetical protein
MTARSGSDGSSGSVPGFDHLRDRLHGVLGLPGEPGYESAAPWNVAVPSRPAAVVAARSVDDVVTAIEFAGANGLTVAVRRTGHGATPLADGTLLIHTGALDTCSVDLTQRRARLGAGALWQQVLDVACPSGLAPVCGSAPGIGVAGYLTGGGLGPLARTYGFSSDHVRAIEVVTGDATLHRVTPGSDADLYWGLLGGKGTLGVVTAIDVDLLPAAGFYGGALWFDASHAHEVIQSWRRMAEELPEDGTTSVALMNLPALPHLPRAIAGRPTVAVRFSWTGEAALGEQHVRQLRETTEPVVDDVRTRPYAEIGRIHADPVQPTPSRYHAALLDDLPATAADALVEAVGPASPHTLVEVRALGGAVARPPEHASAVSHRDAPYALFMSGVPLDGGAALEAHAEGVLSALTPWTRRGLFSNFAPSDDPRVVARCFDADGLNRIVRLADAYDPGAVLAVGQVAREVFDTSPDGRRPPV